MPLALTFLGSYLCWVRAGLETVVWGRWELGLPQPSGSTYTEDSVLEVYNPVAPPACESLAFGVPGSRLLPAPSPPVGVSAWLSPAPPSLQAPSPMAIRAEAEERPGTGQGAARLQPQGES